MLNEVKKEICILNYMRYKKENREGCRISFIMNDPQESKNFVGHPVIDQFYNDVTVFEKLSPELLLQPVMAYFRITSANNNPLRTKSMLSMIETDDDVIDLLQSDSK